MDAYDAETRSRTLLQESPLSCVKCALHLLIVKAIIGCVTGCIVRRRTHKWNDGYLFDWKKAKGKRLRLSVPGNRKFDSSHLSLFLLFLQPHSASYRKTSSAKHL